MMRVCIVDYGLANIRSVVNAVKCFEVDLAIAEQGTELTAADRIILPGVGSFDAGMKGLRERGHEEVLQELVIERQRPYLGICLGLQFLFEGSEEGKGAGLAWFPGKCRRFPSGSNQLKVPHMGWSDIEIVRESRLLAELRPPMTFYFVHSYFVPYEGEERDFCVAICEYGVVFAAAVEKGNIFATQFHPEKSQLAGMKIIEAFLMMP